MTLYYSFVEHPMTRLILFSSENGLRSVHFIPQGESLPDPREYYPTLSLRADGHHHDEVSRQLHQYLDGIPVAFSVILDLIGTPFQKRVWEAIAAIPFGNTRTYGQLAAQVGSPTGFRAVGGATGHNPVPIIIPCHRVMGAKGALTGFSAPDGIELKKKLLRLEGHEY